MSRQITQRELRNDSGAILRAVDEGETFIVTRNGTPMAELRPLPRKRTFTPRAAVLDGLRNLPPVDYAKLRAEIDDVVDDSVASFDGHTGE